jgi:hypothetical protein
MASMAYDPKIRKTVLFGGYEGNTAMSAVSIKTLNDTWTYRAGAWTKQSPTARPSARVSAAMAYDPKIGRIVLFGGLADNTVLNDTWTFDGETWIQQHPPDSPSSGPGYGMIAMDYLPATGKMVLYRGFDYPSGVSDTWTYDGTTWSLQQALGQRPPGRSVGVMAYDPAIQKIVLYGGSSRANSLNDTWTYNGTTWTQQKPITSPNRERGSASTGSMVLFGGQGPGCDSEGNCNDIWTYDGVTWTQQSPTIAPSRRSYASIAYDPNLNSIILFGGGVCTHVPPGSGNLTCTTLGDTWTYEPR